MWRVPLILSALLTVAHLSAQEAVSLETEAAVLLKLPGLKELAAKNIKVEVYRLTVGRSFDPLLIFEIESNALFVRKVRVTNNDDFSHSLRIVRNSRLQLEVDEFRSFVDLIEAGSFWNLPSEDWLSPGTDGSTWKLEGVKDGKYHFIVRSSPFLPFNGGTSLKDDVSLLSPDRAYSEGRMTAAFIYLWTLSGEAAEKLY